MGRDTCKMPNCDKETRNYGDDEYPNDPDKDYTVSAFGARFCSTKHEIKYEHLKADAEDARRAEQESRGTPKRDLPEYDGPPY